MDDNHKTHQLLGELVATVRTTGELVGQLRDGLAQHTQRFDSLQQEFIDVKHGLKHANDDIRQLRDTVVTPEKLRRAGLDLDDHVEHRKDFAHLREARLAAEERKPVYRTVVGAVAGAALIAAGAWAWSAMTDRAASDLHNRIEVKK